MIVRNCSNHQSKPARRAIVLPDYDLIIVPTMPTLLHSLTIIIYGVTVIILDSAMG